MNQQKPQNPRTILHKLRLWLRKRRAVSQKRRSEYLHLSGDNRWQRLLINLHPESLFSFFTSRAGIWFVFKICTTIFLLFLLIITFAYFYYRREVPATVLELQSCVEGQTTEFYDRSGETLIWTIRKGTECERIQLADISPYLINAIISTEDKDFFQHPGYKITSIARSVINNLLNQPTQGGSTITQQYIKNTILKDSSRSYERKIKEIILVPEIESIYSKEEILTAYLNTISFGSIYSGVEASAQGYFGKPASVLTLDEAALLVASVPAPNFMWNNPQEHLARRDFVLNAMLQNNKISQSQFDEAIKIDTLAKVKRSDRLISDDVIAPYFALEAQRELHDWLCANADHPADCDNPQTDGYKIITTLDLETQRIIEATMTEAIDQLEKNNYNNAALLILDNHTREVIGLNGGRDFHYPDFGQVNHTAKPRAPENIWHPLIYAVLLENNSQWGAGRTLYDYQTFKLEQEEFLGPVSLRRALAESILTPTIKAAYIAENEQITQFANDLGLEITECQKDCHIQQTLTTDFKLRLDDLANTYATFSNDGQHQKMSYIRQVFDSYDKTIYQKESQTHEIFNPQTAYMINHILTDADFKHPTLRQHSGLAVKANVSDDFQDNPFVAYTSSITMAGWVGEQLPEPDAPLKNQATATDAQAILINNFLKNYKIQNGTDAKWKKPSGLQTLQTNLASGRITTQGGKADYYSDTFRSGLVSGQTIVQIDRATGKLASQCTPDSSLDTLETYSLVAELASDDPVYRAWMQPIWQNLATRLDSSIPDTVDDLHKCNDKTPSIDVQKNGDCQTGCQLTIKATAGTHDLKTINIKSSDENFQDVSKSISGRVTEINYDHKNLNSSVRALRFEVVDQAFYSDYVIIDL